MLGYHGLDDVVRSTIIQFLRHLAADCRDGPDESIAPAARGGDDSHDGGLRTREDCPTLLRFNDARQAAEAALERYKAWSCHLDTSSEQVNGWLNRAVSDLQMMTTERPTGPYPYAGVPWFNTPFGATGSSRPWNAYGFVRSWRTACWAISPRRRPRILFPSKTPNRARSCTKRVMAKWPRSRKCRLASITAAWTPRRFSSCLPEPTTSVRTIGGFIEALWPHIEAALSWVENYGDRDGDGFVEYQRWSAEGLLHQGWRDSDDAVFHADGRLAEGPIALCEVQGYVYAAWRAAATLAEMLGDAHRAALCSGNADVLWEKFDRSLLVR